MSDVVKYMGKLKINRVLDRDREFEKLSYGEKQDYIDGMIDSLNQWKLDLVEEEKEMAEESYTE